MWKRYGSSALIWICLVAGASGQDVTGERFILTTGPCQMSSGSGSPEGSVVGSPCDEYRQTNASGIALWLKVSGVGTNTGWQALGGLGLANTWTAAQVFSQTTGSVALRALVTGDSYSRFYMTVNGVMYFGSGAATQDVTLYRSGANVLATDDAFTAAGVVTGAGVVSYLATGSTAAVSAGTTGDTYHRWSVDSSGVMGFGSGSAARDVNLYRSAANVLATDDTVSVGAGAWLDYATTATDSGGLVMYVGDGAAARNGYWTLDVQDPTYQYLRFIQNLSGGGEMLRWRMGPTSFTPGAHWTYDLAEDATRVRTLYAGELNVWQLVAKTVTAVNGELVTADTTKLTAALAAGSTTITVADNSLADGDVVFLKSLTDVEFLEIDSAPGGSAGLYTYTVLRNRDGTGANDWPLGQAVMNTGVAGEGFIDQFSTSSEFVTGEQGPTVAWMVRNSATWNDVSPRTVAGNLKGYYGYSTNVYGLAAGDPSDVYITTEATNGFRVFEGGSPRGQWAPDGSLWIGRSSTGARFAVTSGGEVQLYDSSNAKRIALQTTGEVAIGANLGSSAYPGTWISSTGISIFYDANNFFRTSSSGLELVANGAAVLTATTAGNLSLTGTVNALAGYFGSSSSVVSVESGGLVTGADGVIRSSGATAFLTGAGYWLKGGSSPQFRVGDPSGQSMIYEDGDLYIYGDGYNLTPDGGLLFDEATAADDYKRAIRWASNGSVIMGRSDIASLHLRGPSDGTYSQINFYTDYLTFWGGTSSGGNAMELGQDGLYPQTSATLSLGLSNRRWSGFHLEGVAYIYGIDTTTAGDAPVVFSSGGNRLYAASGLATDSALGSCGDGIYSLEVRNGLVVGATCVAPNQSLRARVLALERETAALRAMVAAMGTR